MKRILAGILFLVMVFQMPVVWAAQGASEKAYEHASDEAIFHRVSDWFVTLGKSEEEKQAVLAERRVQREQKRLEKKARAKKEDIGKRAKDMREEAVKKDKKMQKTLAGKVKPTREQ